MRKPRFSNIIRIFKLLGHAGLVLFFLVLPWAFINQTTQTIRSFNPVFTLNYWIYFLSFIGYFYGFTYYIIPRYLITKKYWKFAWILFLLFIFFGLLKPFERIFDDILEIMRGRPDKPYDPFLIDFLTNFVFIMLTALGLSIQVVKQWRLSERRTLQAETEKAQALAEKKTAELSFLKAQINPHFLFNTLNNIYSLAIRQSPNTAPSIMKLSNIMRYLTDDVTKDFIPMKRELECIQDYINLQTLRLGENNIIDFEVTGKTENKKIAPLILMTFIENVFKYGIATQGQTTITIKLLSDKQQITFFCQNSILVTENNLESTGIGLENTRHRLELIYPDRHILDIKNENGLFTVNLTLQN